MGHVILVSSDVHMLPNLSPRDELHLEKHAEVKFIKIAALSAIQLYIKYYSLLCCIIILRNSYIMTEIEKYVHHLGIKLYRLPLESAARGRCIQGV